MTQHRNMQDFNRRDFLGTAAGLTLALALSPDPLAFTGEVYWCPVVGPKH